MPKTIVLTGPDGRYYEIPSDELARYAVPGDRVNEVRQRLAVPEAAPAMPPGHLRPGDPLPPGVPPPPASLTPGPAATTTITTPGGGSVVLNFFFGPPAVPTVAPAGEVEGYHMTFDAHGIPTNHTDMLWGDYIDKQGNPAVGWHSHDPVSGNAQ